MKVRDFSYVEVRATMDEFMEIRREFNGAGQEIFRGYNHFPNASVDIPTWFILKFIYVAGNQERQQLPDEGLQFKYTWTARATYFS
jgi:hypothetical protein